MKLISIFFFLFFFQINSRAFIKDENEFHIEIELILFIIGRDSYYHLVFLFLRPKLLTRQNTTQKYPNNSPYDQFRSIYPSVSSPSLSTV